MNSSYAQILFDAVADKDLCAYNLLVLEEVLKEDVYDFLTSPIVSADDKKSLVDEIKLDQPEVINFLKVLIDAKVIDKFSQIVADYKQIYLDYYNILEVNVSLARQQNEEFINDMINKLNLKLEKNVVLNIDVNPDIIGGIIIQYQDKVVDNSIASKLKQLEKVIKKEVL